MSNNFVVRLSRYSGMTIKELSNNMNISSDKLLELLGYLKRSGKIKDIEFC